MKEDNPNYSAPLGTGVRTLWLEFETKWRETALVGVFVGLGLGSSSYLMDEHVHRFVQLHSVPAGHGQEPEAHAHVEPLTHPRPVEGRGVLLRARSFILLSFANS